MSKNESYEDFVAKFNTVRAKTTDDCYTPQPVYDALLHFIKNEVTPLENINIVRPFWPDTDYRNYQYNADDVVIDNPPFSILSQVLTYYKLHGVKFWLFAPANTALTVSSRDFTIVVVDSKAITYENGAQIPTAFITNMWPGNPACVVCGALGAALAAACPKPQKTTKKVKSYQWPDNYTSVALLQKIAKLPTTFYVIPRAGAAAVRTCGGRSVFGGGWLLSDKEAARLRKEEARLRKEEARVRAIPVELTGQDKLLIEMLNNGGS